jgi:hypothetical protein
VIDRSKTRETPSDPMAIKGREVVRNSRRGNHLGQWSCATTPKGRTYGSKRSDQKYLQKTLASGGRPHMDLARVRSLCLAVLRLQRSNHGFRRSLHRVDRTITSVIQSICDLITPVIATRHGPVVISILGPLHKVMRFLTWRAACCAPDTKVSTIPCCNREVARFV